MSIKVLGVGDVLHDVSLCLMQNEENIAVIEEERFSRVRHGLRFDEAKYNLDEHGQYLDHLILSLSRQQREKKYLELLQHLEEGGSLESFDLIVSSSLFSEPAFPNKVTPISHHTAHAASAFFPSIFGESAILTLDGNGSEIDGQLETTSLGVGFDNKIEILDTITGVGGDTNITTVQQQNNYISISNSVGVMYKNITLLLGLGMYGEGTTMALAAFGNPKKYCHILEQYVSLFGNGFYTIDNLGLYLAVQDVARWGFQKTNNEEERLSNKSDIAAALQYITEKIIIHICNGLHEKTKLKNLCLAGGVALNSKTNQLIRDKTQFNHVFIQPAAGDDGISIGCAMYGYHQIEDLPRKKNKKYTTNLGKVYSDQSIQDALLVYKDAVLEESGISDIYKYVAEQLAGGKIIGWFSGRSEVGPRALGHRSILADPRKLLLKETLDNSIKHRAWYRPYSPVVLEEKACQYFDIIEPSPYMTFVVNVHDKVKDQIPLVVHYDGTARVQTVNNEQDPHLYKLISVFYEITGVPILLNTSFNRQGEPIVESPNDAIDCYIDTAIDILVINQRIFHKFS